MLPPTRPNEKPVCCAACAGSAATAAKTAEQIKTRMSAQPIAVVTLRRMRRAVVLCSLVAIAAGCGGGGGSSSSSSAPKALLDPGKLTAKAPQSYDVTFKTTKGTFVVRVHRAWAPFGADRFYNLVRNHFYDGAAFFRVVPGFVVQFGISPFPAVSDAWQNATIPDDKPAVHNTRGA